MNNRNRKRSRGKLSPLKRTVGTKKTKKNLRSKTATKNTLLNATNDTLTRYNQKKKKFNGGPLEALIYRFEESNRPEKISFREDEKKEIRRFYSEGIRKKGSQTSLYITGMPGLGKTACVMEVIKNLQEEGFNFRTVYINGLKLKSPIEFYTDFLFQLVGIIFRPKEARKHLISYFKGEEQGFSESIDELDDIDEPIILIIDEVDFLYTKDQGIFYNIFDWIHGKNSNLIISTIANTLDFPDRILPKINSRMGKNILIFKPYSIEEIFAILKERNGDSKLFAANTLKMIARKVANYSGDIRKSLNICRKCIYTHKNIEQKDRPKEIVLGFVNEVMQKDEEKPLYKFIKGCALPFKLCFLALLGEVRFGNNKCVLMENLYTRFTDYANSIKAPKINLGQFKLMIKQCDQMKILRLYLDSRDYDKLIVDCKADDIAFALKDEKIIMGNSYLKRAIAGF